MYRVMNSTTYDGGRCLSSDDDSQKTFFSGNDPQSQSSLVADAKNDGRHDERRSGCLAPWCGGGWWWWRRRICLSLVFAVVIVFFSFAATTRRAKETEKNHGLRNELSLITMIVAHGKHYQQMSCVFIIHTNRRVLMNEYSDGVLMLGI
jgi:hypothetical protein